MQTEYSPVKSFFDDSYLAKLIKAKARQIEVGVTEKNCPAGLTIEEFVNLSVFKAVTILELEKKITKI